MRSPPIGMWSIYGRAAVFATWLVPAVSVRSCPGKGTMPRRSDVREGHANGGEAVGRSAERRILMSMVS